MVRQKGNLPSDSRLNTATTSVSSSVVFTDGDVYLIEKFPREFERNFSDFIDKRFISTLLCTFLVHVLFIYYYLSFSPIEEFSQSDIARIQHQFASLVLDQEPIEFEEAEVTQSMEQGSVSAKVKDQMSESDGQKDDVGEANAQNTSGFITESKTATAGERRSGRSGTMATRRQTREAITREVSSKGVLGLLTASGEGASGEGVVDILGELEASTNDLDNVLNNLNGLKTDGSPVKGKGSRYGSGNTKARGGRATSRGSIDDLIGDLDVASSKDVVREGKLVVTAMPPVVEEADGKRGAGRDPDAVSEVVNRHNAAIQACYQRELKRDPNLKGKIAIRFTIAPNGKVIEVKILTSTINNKSVERCVINRIRRWDDFGAIDPSKGNSTFRQVYTFGY